MTQLWQPGTAYSSGAEVDYQGKRYRIIQPHTSQGDWAPDKTPALWGQMQTSGHSHGDDDCEPGRGGGNQSHGGGNQSHGGGQGHQQPPVYGGGGQPQQPLHGNNPPAPAYDSKPQGGHKDDKKDDDNGWEKKLGIAGGILAAGAVIGGGIWVYSEHKDKEEERAKAEEWCKTVSEEAYKKSSGQRCDELKRDNRNMQAYWILAEGGKIPHNAIPVGRESSGEELYFARGYHKGGVHVGKVGKHLKKGACIPYGGDEVHLEFFEVLVGDPREIRWVDQEGRVQIQGLGNPVEGGREADGKFIFPCIIEHKGSVQPGKINQTLDHANFPYGGEEEHSKRYKIATYA